MSSPRFITRSGQGLIVLRDLCGSFSLRITIARTRAWALSIRLSWDFSHQHWSHGRGKEPDKPSPLLQPCQVRWFLLSSGNKHWKSESGLSFAACLYPVKYIIEQMLWSKYSSFSSIRDFQHCVLQVFHLYRRKFSDDHW